ncbi:tripartite tricarboxylate transporter TctB family protein [Yoonia sp. MH D7]
MRLVLFRGIMTATLFGIVLFVMIPAYVPRPAFIPGFAPPPDMWPRTIAILGVVLGLISALQAFARTGVAMADPEADKIWQQTASTRVFLTRVALAILAFVGFVLILPALGFLISSIALTACTILLTGEREKWVWALAVAVTLPTGLLLFFSKALGTQFPLGHIMKSLGL